MTPKSKGIAAMAYAAVSVLVGAWRFLQPDGGTTGLYFGLAIGAIAFAGGVLLLLGRRLAGIVTCFVALGFGGGFFVHRLLSGGAEGDYLRCGLAAAAAVALAVVLLVPGGKGTEAS
jgi:hypothetical protein